MGRCFEEIHMQGNVLHLVSIAPSAYQQIGEFIRLKAALMRYGQKNICRNPFDTRQVVVFISGTPTIYSQIFLGITWNITARKCLRKGQNQSSENTTVYFNVDERIRLLSLPRDSTSKNQGMTYPQLGPRSLTDMHAWSAFWLLFVNISFCSNPNREGREDRPITTRKRYIPYIIGQDNPQTCLLAPGALPYLSFSIPMLPNTIQSIKPGGRLRARWEGRGAEGGSGGIKHLVHPPGPLFTSQPTCHCAQI